MNKIPKKFHHRLVTICTVYDTNDNTYEIEYYSEMPDTLEEWILQEIEYAVKQGYLKEPDHYTLDYRVQETDEYTMFVPQ